MSFKERIELPEEELEKVGGGTDSNDESSSNDEPKILITGDGRKNTKNSSISI